MPFWNRVKDLEPFDTWGAMEAALSERFFDGLSLAVGRDNRLTGAIYLLGYTVEMILKVAYFRFLGVPSAQNLAQQLDAIKGHSLMKKKNLHDLEGWMHLIFDVRSANGMMLNPAVAAELRRNVGIAQSNWKETLRYKSTLAVAAEIEEMFSSVNWLYNHRQRI